MRLSGFVNAKASIARLIGFRDGTGLSLRKIPNEAAMPKQIAHSKSPALSDAGKGGKVSPLMLCDHLIQVAQEADEAGYVQTAAHLVALVDRMFDSAPQRH